MSCNFSNRTIENKPESTIDIRKILNYGLSADPSSFVNLEGVTEASTELLAETSSDANLREVVFGFQEDALSNTRASFNKSMAFKRTEFLTIFEHETTHFRLLPSINSSFIFELDSSKLTSQFPDDQVSLIPFGKLEEKNYNYFLKFSEISGLDIRFTSKYKLQSQFSELPEVIGYDTANFDREDMGRMSCTSVVGMEFKDRILKDPIRFLKDVHK